MIKMNKKESMWVYVWMKKEKAIVRYQEKSDYSRCGFMTGWCSR